MVQSISKAKRAPGGGEGGTPRTMSLPPPHPLETLQAAVGLKWLSDEGAAPSASPTSTAMAEQKEEDNAEHASLLGTNGQKGKTSLN